MFKHIKDQGYKCHGILNAYMGDSNFSISYEDIWPLSAYYQDGPRTYSTHKLGVCLYTCTQTFQPDGRDGQWRLPLGR